MKMNVSLELNFTNTTTITANTDTKLSISDPFLTRMEVIVLSIVFFTALFGNLIVIIYLCLSITMSKKMKRALGIEIINKIPRMSFYIIHLSIADMSVALLSILPQIVWRKSVLFFASSQLLCKFVTFAQVLNNSKISNL